MDKKKPKTKISDSKNIKAKILYELSKLYSEDLIWILKNKGESAFSKSAKYLGLSEKIIDKVLKIWRKKDE